MARILDTDTEAFAPVQHRIERVPGQTAAEKLQNLGLMANVAKEAMPFADLAVRGIDTAYGGIKDWFAESGKKDEAEKAALRRAKGLDDSFSGTEVPAQPTQTEAVAKGVEETPEQKIASERLFKMMNEQAAMSPDEQERYAKEQNEMIKRRYAEERDRAAKIQAEKFYAEHPDVARDVKSDTLSKAGQALAQRDVNLAQDVALAKYRAQLPFVANRVEKEKEAQNAQRERDFAAGLANKLPPQGVVTSPEREAEIMGEVAGDWFKPGQETGETKGPVFGKSYLEGPARESLNLRRAKPVVGDMHLDWFNQPAEQESRAEAMKLNMPAAAAEAPAATTTEPTRRPVGHPAIEGVLIPPERKPVAAAEPVAQPRQPAAAPVAKPATPRTIGEATDEQLDMVKQKLEAQLKTNPTNQMLANRLKDVDDEMSYRKVEKAPRTYSEWQALARQADTSEEQAKVLEYAKNIHMPSGGLLDLFTPNTQLAERQALGSREEKGLFPETARESASKAALNYATAELKLRQGKRVEELTPAEREAIVERSEYYRAGAGLRGQQAQDLEETRPYRVGKMEEQIQTEHERHKKIAAETNAIEEKLGPQIDKLKAESAKLRSLRQRAAGGGGLSKADFQLMKEYDKRAKERVQEADKIAAQAEANAERAAAAAETAQLRAEMAKREVSEDEDTANLFGRARDAALARNAEREKARAISEQMDAVASTQQSAAQKAQEAVTKTQENRSLVVKIGDEDRGIADDLARKYLQQKGIIPPVSTRNPQPGAQAPAAPVAAPPAAKANAGYPPGVKPTGTTKVGTPKDSSQKMNFGLGSDGKWYPLGPAK